MIRYLSLEEVLELHRLALEQSGGLDGIRDLGMLESAVVQPQMAFAGEICCRRWQPACNYRPSLLLSPFSLFLSL